MKELKINDICDVCRKIQKIAEGSRPGEILTYLIEKKPRERAENEITFFEKLVNVRHVISLSGRAESYQNKIKYQFRINSKQFQQYIEDECNPEDDENEKEERTEISVSIKWGLILNGDIERKCRLSRRRIRFIFNLIVGCEIDHEITTKFGEKIDSSNLNREVSVINKRFKETFNLPEPLILGDTNGYYLNELVYKVFRDEEFLTDLN